ncbi:MAG: ABC transporter substrate-binding protein [Deltaproteobacteria bacterium]|nr:ABC transporter substrate-binding protein [Deltaproteobacteria bacterium]
MIKKIPFITMLLLLVLGASVGADPLKKVWISSKGAGETTLPYVIAQRLGFYSEEGFQIEVVVTRGTIATQALIGGSVGYTNAAVLPAILNGAGLKIVLVDADKPAQYLVSAPKIVSLNQLVGKTVAISDFSGNAFLLMKELFAKNGVPIGEVKVRVFGEPNLRLNALMNNLVDATMLSYELVKPAQAKGYRILAYSGDYISSLSSSLSTTDAKIKESPEELYRVVKATLKGQLFWYRNPETVKFLMEVQALSDEGLAREIWRERTKRGSEIAQMGRATEEDMVTNIERVKEQMRLAGAVLKIKGDITVSQVYDFSFVKRAYEELATQGWDPMKYRYIKKR